jgi:hypothetical protein
MQMRAIAGEDYITARSTQQQWIGKHLKNDVSKCMLVLPTLSYYLLTCLPANIVPRVFLLTDLKTGEKNI